MQSPGLVTSYATTLNLYLAAVRVLFKTPSLGSTKSNSVFPETGYIDCRCLGTMSSYGEDEKKAVALQGHRHTSIVWFRASPHWEKNKAFG